MSILFSILKLFVISALGYVIYRHKIKDEKFLDGLTILLTEIIVPCLIISTFIESFNWRDLVPNLLAAVYMPLLALLSLVMSYLVAKIMKIEKDLKEFIALNIFHNSVILPVPILSVLVSKTELPVVYMYIFMFQLFQSPLVWSLGVSLLSKIKNREKNLQFGAPFYATLAGLVLSLPGIRPLIPEFVSEVMNLTGQIATPLAMLCLGGIIANIGIFKGYKLELNFQIGLIITKMLLIPLVVFLIIYFFRIPRLFGLFMLVESAVPPALNLSIISQRYRGNTELICSSITTTYIVSLVTIPLFICLLKSI